MNSIFRPGVIGLPALAAAMLIAGGCAIAAAEPLSPARMLDVCTSRSVAEAGAKGDRLGWQAVPDSDPDMANWKKSYVGYNGGSVAVVSWHNQSGESLETLSFWVGQGPNPGQVCAYTTTKADKLLDELTAIFGTPSALDRNEMLTSGSWKWQGNDIFFSQIGSTAEVSVSP